ncbi:Ig-like domain-containing protein, partial [Bacteroidales bacterium OttesenSCG-928-M11]|nr:Ig-like domain-containing protein [Bacteroidales bacterium OttesenSCG-928-M11]
MKKLFFLVMGFLLMMGSANAQAIMPEVSDGVGDNGPWYIIQVKGGDTRVGLCFTSYFDTQFSESALKETLEQEMGDLVGRYRVAGNLINVTNLDAQSWRLLAGDNGSYKLQNKKTKRIVSYQIPDIQTKTEDILFLDANPTEEAQVAILSTVNGKNAQAGYFFLNATSTVHKGTQNALHQSNELGAGNYSVILTSGTASWGTGDNSSFRFVEANGIWPSANVLNYTTTIVGESSAAQTISISNIGQLTDAFSYKLEGNNASEFAVTEKEWTAAAAGTLDVTFNPTTAGEKEAFLVITNGTVSSKILLTAKAIPAYAVVISPSVGHAEADANGDVWYRIQYAQRSQFFLAANEVGGLVEVEPYSNNPGQLWKFTGKEKECVMVNKLGYTISYTTTASFTSGTGGTQKRFIVAEESDAVVDFLISTTAGGGYVLNVVSLTYKNATGEDATLANAQFNKERAPGFTNYNSLGDQGNALVLHYASKKDIATPSIPKMSSGDISYWYTLQFTRNADKGKYIQANAAPSILTQVVPAEIGSEHYFKFVGTWNNFKIVSYDGTEVKYVVNSEGTVVEDGDSYRFNGFSANSLEIYNNLSGVSGAYLNDKEGATVEHYNGGDGGNQLNIDFVKEEYFGTWYQVQTMGSDAARKDLAWTVEYDEANDIDRVYGRALATDGGAMASQLWVKVATGEDTYALKNRATGKLMDLKMVGTYSAPIAIVTEDSAAEWKFTEESATEGYWRIQGTTTPKTNYSWLHQGNNGFNFNLIAEVETWSKEGNSQFKFIECTTNLTADEAPVDFGAVVVDQTATHSVLVSINRDVRDAKFEYKLTGDAVFAAELSETWNNAGGNIVITFAPVANGTFTASLEFSYDGIEKTVAITGTAFTPVSVTGVTLDKTAETVIVGNELQLVATVNPADADDKTVTWSTSDATVATVNATGLVTTLKEGTATITVTTTDGDHTATCVVTVVPVPVTGVTLDKTAETVLVGNSVQLTATVNPANAGDKSVTWSTSDATVAVVSVNGLVSALKAGTATITVTTTDGAHKATCVITVEAGDAIDTIDSIAISLDDNTIRVKNANVSGLSVYNVHGALVATTEG